MRWEQKDLTSAVQCELCRQSYGAQFSHPPSPSQQDRRWPRSPDEHSPHMLPSPPPPTAHLPLQPLRTVLLQLVRNPEHAFFRAWGSCIVLAGLGVGAHHGLAGLSVGACLGLRAAWPIASVLLRLAPEAGLLAATLPSLQPSLRLLACLAGSALAAEVAAASAAGLLFGGTVGFFKGTAQAVCVTAQAGNLALHAAVAALSALMRGTSMRPKAGVFRGLSSAFGLRGVQLSDWLGGQTLGLLA